MPETNRTAVDVMADARCSRDKRGRLIEKRHQGLEKVDVGEFGGATLDVGRRSRSPRFGTQAVVSVRRISPSYLPR